jgi:predicted aspartyl protease
LVRYSYLPQLSPPAPFVYVTLRNPVTGQELRGVPAQLDTAADRTLLPAKLASELALPQIRAMKIGLAGGSVREMPVYPVTLAIHDFAPLTIEVVSSAGEDWILLGRDVLNAHRLLLDGPRLGLEIERPEDG